MFASNKRHRKVHASMSSYPTNTEVILALDVESRQKAMAVLAEVGSGLKWVKVGLQSFLRDGPDFVQELADTGYDVFLDLKLHDIPNTVLKAIESLSGLPIGMFTMHACAGSECMKAAAETTRKHLTGAKLLAVTVLTSLNEDGLREIGLEGAVAGHVERLAKLAVDSEVDGIVCSPLEIEPLRRILPKETALITPGIRPSGTSKDEQKRVLSPADASGLGADYLVIGRPILNSPNPAEAFHGIMAELENTST